MNKIHVLEDFVDSNELRDILEIARSATEVEWNVFNEESVNGPFWNGKRLMIDQSKTILLNKKIQGIWQSTNFTASNKVQRFLNGENLGPITDSQHANIKEAMVIFLNAGHDGCGIKFGQEGVFVEASQNLAVFYSGETEYEIVAPKASDPMYFITIFLNKDA